MRSTCMAMPRCSFGSFGLLLSTFLLRFLLSVAMKDIYHSTSRPTQTRPDQTLGKCWWSFPLTIQITWPRAFELIGSPSWHLCRRQTNQKHDVIDRQRRSVYPALHSHQSEEPLIRPSASPRHALVSIIIHSSIPCRQQNRCGRKREVFEP